MTARPHTRIIIVGTGFSGLGAAIRLRQEGINDFVILERATDLGGTWRDNSYPGCACDVPSRLYSFSFAQSNEWSRTFSTQPEIWAYLKSVAADHSLAPFIRYGCALASAHWDDGAKQWSLETTAGPMSASVLLLATGAQSEPLMPALTGLASFGGVAFHSARWRHDYDLTGKRVAVIGTGASAIQFVPAIQPHVAKLHLFQRTAPWVVPRRDRVVSERERTIYRTVPGLRQLARGWMYATREATMLAFRHLRGAALLERLARRHLAAQLPDRSLREKLTPHFAFGCKRVLLSNDYYPALTKPNAEVVTDAIREIEPRGVVTHDGRLREVDAIILGTGFRPTDPPLAPHITGRDGRTLAQAWSPSMRAYASTTVSGFPNLFIVPGPNAGIGHTSLIYMIESQLSHVVSALQYMTAAGVSAMEPRAAAQANYAAAIDERMRGTVWTAGGCQSWYIDASGRNSVLWPDFTFRFRQQVARMNPRHYLLTHFSSNTAT